MAENLDLAYGKTLGLKLHKIKVEMEAELVVDTRADTLANMKTVTFGKTLDNVTGRHASCNTTGKIVRHASRLHEDRRSRHWLKRWLSF